ncbi:hypothetical protein ACPUEN_14030 [Algoriphagus yeomjeoni]|uniref:hypothetical protein n=1 Tax=Algoriphagus yeomjeoni TaxID=291403 RepID=UPI003CE4D5C6
MRQFILLPIFVLSFGASAQLSTSYVENWINSCEPEGNLDSLERLYIINGVPFDNPEDELKSFDTKNQLWFIDYLNSDSVETTFMKPNLLVILVGATPKLKKGERIEKLHEQQSKFSDEFDNSFNLHPNPKDPVLILNDKLISPENAGQTISKLRPNDVRYIQYVNHTSFALYGQNAKNGAVTIWTKEYAR